jgi:hypothetical protein
MTRTKQVAYPPSCSAGPKQSGEQDYQGAGDDQGQRELEERREVHVREPGQSSKDRKPLQKRRRAKAQRLQLVASLSLLVDALDRQDAEARGDFAS